MSDEQVAAEEMQASQGGEALAGKYLTFFLADERYGVEITKVREIIGVLDITAVPQTADYLLGVINLRGKVIPVMDLRMRFGQEYREADERTCIIVMEIVGRDEQRMFMSVMVDQVDEVVTVGPDEVEPSPAISGDVDASFILGLAKTAGGVRILLDVDRIVRQSRLVTS